MMTPTTLRIGLVAVALLALSSCTSDSDWAAEAPDTTVASAGEPTAATSPTPEWLFAMQSDGETTFDAATGQLSMPTGAVHAFTDRPYRDTKVTSPHTFVDLWQRTGPDSFDEDPPNAVLTYWETVGETAVPRTVVCEITGEVGYSTGDGRLSMGLRVLEPEGATLPARMSRASLFVDDVAGSPCPDSATDETNVEYFNLINYEGAIDLQVQYVPATDVYQVWLDCPQRTSPSEPSAEFDIRLTTGDQRSTASCYSTDKLSLPKQNLAGLSYCNDQQVCTFDVTAVNSESKAVYSETRVSVTMGTDVDLIPQLQPATVPVCEDFGPDGPIGPI